MTDYVNILGVNIINTNLVSVVMPAYNVEDFIGEAIQSVQNQTYKEWELLIVDDGSLDSTFKIATKFAQIDNRINIIQQKNSGPYAARQTALNITQGRYIAFLDSDDYWLPNKLSLQLKFMQKNNASLSYTRFRRININDNIEGHLISIPEKINYQGLLRNTALATSTVIVDRQKTGIFKIGYDRQIARNTGHQNISPAEIFMRRNVEVPAEHEIEADGKHQQGQVNRIPPRIKKQGCSDQQEINI